MTSDRISKLFQRSEYFVQFIIQVTKYYKCNILVYLKLWMKCETPKDWKTETVSGNQSLTEPFFNLRQNSSNAPPV